MTRDVPRGLSGADPLDPGLLPCGFARFIAVRLAGFLADQTATFVVPVAVYVATGAASLAGIAFVVQWAPRVLCSPLLGIVVDRFGARAQFLAVDLGRMAVLAVLACVPDPAVLIAGSALLTLMNGHASLATESVLARAVGRAAMARAQSLQQTAFQLAMVTGPAVGGWALALAGPRPTLAVVAAAFGLTALATTLVVQETGRHGAAGKPSLQEVPGRLAEGFRAVRRRPRLRTLIAVTAVVNLVGGLALVTLPVVVIDTFGGRVAVAGTLAGLGALLSVVAAVLVGVLSRRVDVGRIGGAGFVLLAASAVLMGLAPGLVAFGIGFGLWAAGITVFMVWMRTRRLELIGADDVGTTLGIFVAAVLAATPVSGLVLAVLGDAVPPQTLLLGTAVVSAGALVPLFLRWRTLRPVAEVTA